MTTPLSYDVASAAAATGVSVDVIRRALRSGDLRAVTPKVDGRRITKLLIRAADLEAWLTR